MIIDILIPTYNREQCLIKNILHLDRIIKKERLQGYFNLLVSDNCSTDNTVYKLAKCEHEIDLRIKLFRQEKNIGPEKNGVFLLKESKADFIMYIGDDDYLPDGYLSYIVDKLKNNPLTTAIVAGLSNLYLDGTVIPYRTADFDEMEYPPGFSTVFYISHFGHQLSGMLLKRERLLDEYTKQENLRNIYPWIFFLAYNNLRGITYYAPKFKILVSQGNLKDWCYDDSGLLIDILKNYKILYPKSKISRLLLSISFAKQQSWRLRIGSNVLNAVKAFVHIIKSKDVDLLFKLSLIALYPYCYLEKIIRYPFKKNI